MLGLNPPTLFNEGRNVTNATFTAPGFLPHHAGHLAQWLSDQVKAAQKDRAEQGPQWGFLPVMNEFISFLDSDEYLKGAVVEMVKEGQEVHQKHLNSSSGEVHYISSLDDLLTIMNFQIIRAPVFAPNVPHAAFPFSGIFVYMMFTFSGAAVFRYAPFNAALKKCA